MLDEKIARINFLAKKAKEGSLSTEELAEQKLLRTEYIAGFRKSLKSTLDNTSIVDPAGNKTKLRQKH